MMGQTIMDPNYDWCLKSVPQKNCNDREIILPRGKVLGGSSALNFLYVASRGNGDRYKRSTDALLSLPLSRSLDLTGAGSEDTLLTLMQSKNWAILAGDGAH